MSELFNERIITPVKTVFFHMSEDEKIGDDESVNDGRMDKVKKVRASGGEIVRGGDSDKIDPGSRTDRWFERIENIVDENRSRSLENRFLLERMDYRTVWIARILVGILVSVVAGYALTLL